MSRLSGNDKKFQQIPKSLTHIFSNQGQSLHMPSTNQKVPLGSLSTAAISMDAGK